MDQTNQTTNTRQSRSISVDDSEFELIERFIEFVRGRERGVFTAEISTNNSNSERFVVVSTTEKKKVNMKIIATTFDVIA